MRERWIATLKETGAMQIGHFLLSSGRHSGEYVQCALALQLPENSERFGRALAEAIATATEAGGSIDCVISPPLGGILIGYEVARHLGRPFLFPERGNDAGLQLRRGFSLAPATRVCVIEDVITTGRTTREVIELVRNAGARPVALGAIIDRSVDHKIDGLAVSSVLRLDIPTYAPEECPLCVAGIPITKPGSRRTEGDPRQQTRRL